MNTDPPAYRQAAQSCDRRLCAPRVEEKVVGERSAPRLDAAGFDQPTSQQIPCLLTGGGRSNFGP